MLIDTMYDIWPVNAPGMPPIGRDFVNEAIARGDLETSIKGTGKNTKIKTGTGLEDLIAQALYGRGELQMKVTAKATKTVVRNIIAGHRWGEDPDGPTAGPTPCDVMIIGKMLGAEDAQKSRHFMGNSGQHFFETLRKLDIRGISRWYVTPVLKCEQPEETNSFRDVWVKNFIHLLHQELRLVRPKYVLCLGSDAAKALLGKNVTLGKLEGLVVDHQIPIHRSADDPVEYHDMKVMACVNPAAVLRAPETQDKFELALLRFSQLIDGKRWDLEETDLDHRVIDNEKDLEALVHEVQESGPNNIIAMDAEWHGEHPQNTGSYLRCIQVSWNHKKAACIVLRGAGGVPAFKRFERRQHEGRAVRTKRTTTKGGERTAIRLLNKMLKGNRPCGHFFCADLEWLVPLGLDLRQQFAAPLDWRDCKDYGGLDTALMAHAVDEVGDFSLTGQTLRYTGAPRYDIALTKWKEQYCKKNNMQAGELEGYGECPDEILYPYANYDADVTRRICLQHIKNLDNDRFGNNCWEAFWISQRAALAVLEIKMTGLTLDKKRVDEMTGLYMETRNELERKIRAWARWPELNLNSVHQVRELLFGSAYNGKDNEAGKAVKLRPKGARSIKTIPILTTEKRQRRWDEVPEDERAGMSASTNRATLAIMEREAESLPILREGEWTTGNFRNIIGWIRDYRFISQVLKSVLRPPAVNAEDSTYMEDSEGDWIYSAGLPGVVCSDGKVRTTIYQTMETGRWSSARPPLQNLSKRREADYKRILGDLYKYPLRSIICASPGHVLVEADYIGAELFGMAIMAGDTVMIEHATRNQLPEDHPDYYDIHSNIAKLAFGYDCEPTKAGLASIGKKHMRIVAKTVIFGIAYGRGAKAIALGAKEEGVDISKEEAQRVIDAVFEMYSGLQPFFNECRARACTQDGSYDELGKVQRAPRWMCGPYGRFRRFPATNDRKVKGDLERQAQNFPIQGMIADAVSIAIANLYDYRENAWADGWTKEDIDYRIVLQIHDAIILEVPYIHVPRVIDEVLPACMRETVPIYPCSLDGVPRDEGPYYLGIDTEVATHWGVHMMPDECESIGLDPEYAGWKKVEEGLISPEAFPKKIWRGGQLHAV